MRIQHRASSWVVYQMAIRGTPGVRTAICEQSEWAAMEVANPGGQTLIREGIGSEPEAERLARSTGYDAAKSKRW